MCLKKLFIQKNNNICSIKYSRAFAEKVFHKIIILFHAHLLILISCKNFVLKASDRIDYCQCKVFYKFSFSQRILMILRKRFPLPRDLATQCYIKKRFPISRVDKSVFVVIWSRTHFIRVISIANDGSLI